jgi:hypothetical protein
MFVTLKCTRCGLPVARYDDSHIPASFRGLVAAHIAGVRVQHPELTPECDRAAAGAELLGTRANMGVA